MPQDESKGDERGYKPTPEILRPCPKCKKMVNFYTDPYNGRNIMSSCCGVSVKLSDEERRLLLGAPDEAEPAAVDS